MIDSLSRAGFDTGFSLDFSQVFEFLCFFKWRWQSESECTPLSVLTPKSDLTILESFSFFNLFSHFNQIPQMRLNAHTPVCLPGGLVGKIADIIVTQILRCA